MTTIADAPNNATVEQLTQAVISLQETVGSLQNTVEQQAETIDRQDERIDDLEAELENQSNNVAGAFAKLSAIDDRLEALEEGEVKVNSNSDSDTDDNAQDQSNETPLEQICSLPEEVAQSELTANQIRARFVAKDVTDYAQSVPAGYRIDTTTMRKVLSANPDENATIHRTTTKRVMKFLDRFGNEEVTIRKQRDGRNSVVFTEELVERLERSDVCNGESANGALLTA